jgi:hypothetical protein
VTLRVGAESKRLGFAVPHHMLSLSVLTAGYFRLALEEKYFLFVVRKINITMLQN